MEKIQTAEEFLQDCHPIGEVRYEDIPDLMIRFAKMHRELILNSICDKGLDGLVATYRSVLMGDTKYISETSVFNSYPETNIK